MDTLTHPQNSCPSPLEHSGPRRESGLINPDFDPHFKIFHELMPFKVQEILLVSSLYDAFLMEEDGSLATRLINEYHGLNLSRPPKITRVSTAAEAIDIVTRRTFELVITMPFLGSVDAFELGRAIKRIRPALPVILLAHSLRPSFLERSGTEGIDRIFIWCCEADLLLAIVKNVEDHRNVDSDTQKAMVRVIIYIEDSPFYRSIFLPLIYREVVRQTQSVLDESLNERHRLLRMRARPKILMATGYEEALALYEAYRPYVFAVISDARFSRQGKMDGNAGIELLTRFRDDVPDLPLLLLSSESSLRHVAERIPAMFIDKNSPLIRDEVHAFFLDHLGFGDFVFRLPDGSAVGRAANLVEFEQCVRQLPADSLRYHADRNHFCNWVMARAEVALGRRLHREVLAGITDTETMRNDIVCKVHSLRQLRQRGVVARFSPAAYDPDVLDFVRIGNGSMGGKARGLAFIWACLQGIAGADPILARHPVSIPKTCIITADAFESFIAENGLHRQEDLSDETVTARFLASALPEWLRRDLAAFLQRFTMPLTVRSSSLLEDGQFKPYAGLYSTFFLANNHPDFNQRRQQLETAIKLVYASTWFEGPRAFSRISGQNRDDAMAVIVQQAVGRRYRDFHYPAISGVAQSYNYYPVAGMRAEEGIVSLALGAGRTVVEGEKSLWFSPARPRHLVQFSTVEEMLSNSQRQFYALDMCGDFAGGANSNLTRRDIQEAENEAPVQLLASTYLPGEHRIRDDAVPGPKIVTFARILKYDDYPLPHILTRLLRIGREGMGCEVEIEFAVDLEPKAEKSSFYFLQIRPMATGRDRTEVSISDRDRRRAICVSGQSLGHGLFTGMTDVIYVREQSLDQAATRAIAAEIGGIGRMLRQQKRSFLLVGPGRWGTADPWLGIPVQWGDIAGVGAIVEVRGGQLRADSSQGSHFFQNLTSLGIPYLTVNLAGATPPGRDLGGTGDLLDLAWLELQPVVQEGRYIRHIRPERPFAVKCNGEKGEAVILPGSEDQ
ncbi:MAG: phosphoenolpyruvate synthase/pyruvate phosphate dikinase [Desulfobulbaceae bacterium]|nr:MAG: phosphoenolpyruvate synthase/pyruvate phosphate dikinase [Desulfobulbaceae bacterium]